MPPRTMIIRSGSVHCVAGLIVFVVDTAEQKRGCGAKISPSRYERVNLELPHLSLRRQLHQQLLKMTRTVLQASLS